MIDAFLSRKYVLLVLFSLMAYCLFWWIYKLDFLPGLHGDEAWVGLKADEYQRKGIDQLSGMTYYTGILQTLLAEFSFKILGIGVFQLRIPGVFINLIGLILIVVTFISNKLYKQSIVFLLIITSSSLYIISARIAWEVNTFTLFFIALSFFSVMKINQSKNQLNLFWIVLFWIVNILGSYNHIIFSCISASVFLGLLLWSIYNDSKKYHPFLIMAGINLFNVCFVFFVMYYQMNFLAKNIKFLPLIIGLFITIESLILFKFKTRAFKIELFSKIPPKAILWLLVIFSLWFIVMHGIGFFEVLSSYKFIVEAYSHECSLPIRIILILCAITTGSYMSLLLIQDIKKNVNSLPAYIIICYLGLFNLYNNNSSLRYYLVLYSLLAIYMAFKIPQIKSKSKLFIITQIILLLTINVVLINIFSRYPAHVRAIDFKIGNGQDETSAHFLPKQPLVDFLKRNKIGQIDYLMYPYFIEKPVQFYKLISPWKESAKNKAVIYYDYILYNNGFIMIKR